VGAISPQGRILALCIAQLPDRTIPRHSWAAEVLVEQLWMACDRSTNGDLQEALSPLVDGRGVHARRVRSEMWELARAGLLEAKGVGGCASFAVPRGAEADLSCRRMLTADDILAIERAAAQLTARLLALSKAARASV